MDVSSIKKARTLGEKYFWEFLNSLHDLIDQEVNSDGMQMQHAQADSILQPGEDSAPIPTPARANSHQAAAGIAPITRTGKKVGRNDPCPCGSGKKYKQCCGKIS